MNIDIDILNELKNISPLLAGIPKTTVFTVPDGYFNTISRDFFLNHMASASSNIDAGEPSAVPVGYFDNLSNLIIDKIKMQDLQINFDDIQLSNQLLQAPKNTIFDVPPDYFTNLSTQIITIIKETAEADLLQSDPIIKSAEPINVFEVPLLYFDTLPAVIINKINGEMNTSENEVTLSDPLKFARTRNVFNVPEGYFDVLPGKILEVVDKEMDSLLLSVLLQNDIRRNVFEVPDNYFANLTADLTSKILNDNAQSAVDEIDSISPLLHGLQKQTVFEVPAGYFDNLAAVVYQKAQPITAKVIILPKRKVFARLAAAAILTIALGTGIYNYSTRPAKQTIVAAFVTTPANITDSSVEKGKKMNSTQLDEALNNLSKEEVITYLEKNNSEEDMALLTSSLDENTLPDKDEYLLDEKTLDKYLDVIKSQN